MKNFAKILAITCLLATPVVIAEESQQASPEKPQAATASTNTSATLSGFKQDMAAFKQEMSMKLEGAESEIMALKEKAKIKGSKVKESTITDLEKNKAKIKSDLDILDKSSESTWKNMKTKIAHAMDELNTKTQKALRE